MNSKTLYRVLSNRLLHHAVFWVISCIVFANTFKVSEYVQKIDYIYSALFHISLSITVYLNLFVLVPKLLSREKFVLYALGATIVLIIGIFINLFTFNWLSDKLLNNYYFISYYSYSDLLKFFFVYLAITTLLKLSKSWFRVQEMHYRMGKIEKEHINTELKALKAQINPHFLFNSLNLIYSLAIKHSKYTPEAIIQLSDILRYVTYDTKNERIELKKEIAVIENYIALQRLRVDKDANITFEYRVGNSHLKIAPMLFLPLIENSFKHGIGGDTSNTFVHLSLNSDNGQVHFEVENNIGKVDKSILHEDGGIGLENIKKRLELLYPEKYTFEVSGQNGIFKVKLYIKYEN